MGDGEFAPGMRVMVDMAGLPSGSARVGLGGWVGGVVIGADGDDISVQLNVAVGGVDQVVVGPDRVIRTKST